MTAIDDARGIATPDGEVPAATGGATLDQRTAPWPPGPGGAVPGPKAEGADVSTPARTSVGGPPAARRPPWFVVVVVALVVAIAVAGAGYGLDATFSSDPAPEVMGPGEVSVQVDVEHSLFSPEDLRVVEGTRVRFVVVNGDPINHELIVGPPDIHARHANGTEAEHPSIPGEVSVGPNGTAVTTFRFDEAGTFEFACHLPGHYEHGMHGEVEVVAADD